MGKIKEILTHLFGNKIPLKKHKRMKRHYKKLLKEKDKKIKELEEENKTLMKNALTQAKKRKEVNDQAQKLIDINKELRNKNDS